MEVKEEVAGVVGVELAVDRIVDPWTHSNEGDEKQL